MKNKTPKKQELLLYTTQEGDISIEVFYKNESVWLNQDSIAQLFGVNRPAITKHLGNIFKSQELRRKSVSSILEHTALDGKRYKTKYYNLDAIIAVGYRVNSKKATQFRIWATNTLKSYILRGYAINKKLVKRNYELFQNAVDDIRKLLPSNTNVQTIGILEIIRTFSNTWLSLDAYDREKLQKTKRG